MNVELIEPIQDELPVQEQPIIQDQSLVQGSQDWLNLRKKCIGASDAPVIMQSSPYKTRYALWEEKVGINVDEFRNCAMQRGLDLEHKARLCFEQKMNMFMPPRVMFHNKIKWMMASLDGMDMEEKHIVEIKCAGREDHKLAKNGKIPEKYHYQIQHQLEVTGLDMAYYFSFDGNDGVIVEVGRNTKDILNMLDEEKEFYRCMQEFYPPKLSDKDFHLVVNEEWEMCAIEWEKIQTQQQFLDKRDKELRIKLIEMAEAMGKKNLTGGGVKVCKSTRKGNIQYDKVPELHKVDLEKHRGAIVEFWRFTRD